MCELWLWLGRLVKLETRVMNFETECNWLPWKSVNFNSICQEFQFQRCDCEQSLILLVLLLHFEQRNQVAGGKCIRQTVATPTDRGDGQEHIKIVFIVLHNALSAHLKRHTNLLQEMSVSFVCWVKIQWRTDGERLNKFVFRRDNISLVDYGSFQIIRNIYVCVRRVRAKHGSFCFRTRCKQSANKTRVIYQQKRIRNWFFSFFMKWKYKTKNAHTAENLLFFWMREHRHICRIHSLTLTHTRTVRTSWVLYIFFQAPALRIWWMQKKLMMKKKKKMMINDFNILAFFFVVRCGFSVTWLSLLSTSLLNYFRCNAEQLHTTMTFLHNKWRKEKCFYSRVRKRFCRFLWETIDLLREQKCFLRRTNNNNNKTEFDDSKLKSRRSLLGRSLRDTDNAIVIFDSSQHNNKINTHTHLHRRTHRHRHTGHWLRARKRSDEWWNEENEWSGEKRKLR